MNEAFPCILLMKDNVLENIMHSVEFSVFSGLGLRLCSPDWRQKKSQNFVACDIVMKGVLSIVGSNDLSVLLERGGVDYCSILCDIDRDIHTG